MQWFFWGVFQPVPSREAAALPCFNQHPRVPHVTVNLPRLWICQWPRTVKASQKFLPPKKGHILRRDFMGPKSLDINNPFRKASKVPFLPSTPCGFQRPSTWKDENPAVIFHRKIHQAQNFSKWQDAKWRNFRSLQGFVLRRSYRKHPEKFHRICLLFPYHSLFAGHANLMV